MTTAPNQHPPAFRVTFVCTGNICRSPMAEVIFRATAERAGLGERVWVTSAGTGDWHVGEQADSRTIAALARHGYDGSRHRARQFSDDDFAGNDLVVVLDRSHERALKQWARSDDDDAKIALLRSFAPGGASPEQLDVPDPYYGAEALFDEVLVMIEDAVGSLFRQLEPALRATVTPPSTRR